MRKRKTNVTCFLQETIKVEEPIAQTIEPLVQRFVFVAGKHIHPLQANIHEVEDKTTEQSIFGIGDEALYLSGRSGE